MVNRADIAAGVILGAAGQGIYECIFYLIKGQYADEAAVVAASMFTVFFLVIAFIATGYLRKEKTQTTDTTETTEKGTLKMVSSLWLHFLLLGLVVIVAVVLPRLYPFEVTALTAEDTSRTLLALNGTLLALVVAFATFYFSVLDTRRMDLVRRSAPTTSGHSDPLQNISAELSSAYVPLYREKMRVASKLLISIASTYSFFLFITYAVYLYSSTAIGNLTGLAIYGLSVSAASPLVTVADTIIMTWFLTKDVAGRSAREQARATEQST
jgi:hypothetical protein